MVEINIDEVYQVPMIKCFKLYALLRDDRDVQNFTYKIFITITNVLEIFVVYVALLYKDENSTEL